MTDMSQSYSWTQPQCGRCWNVLHPDHQLRSPGAARGPCEQCVMCGELTFSGIYVRVDPAIAPYPSLTKDAA